MGCLLMLMLLGASPAADETSRDAEIEQYLDEPWHVPMEVYWSDGVTFRTLDKAFKLRLRARMLWDVYGASSNDFGSELTEDGTYMRQTRFGFLGYMAHRVLYTIEYEFSSGSPRAVDVYVGLNGLGPFGQLWMGHFREPFGLDATTPLPYLSLLERAPSTRAFGLGRNAGIRFHNDILDRQLTYWFGVFRRTTPEVEPKGDGGYTVTARITGLPSFVREERLLHLGVSASFRDAPDGKFRYNARHAQAEGPRLADTFEFDANYALQFVAESAFQAGAFTVQAEMYWVHIDRDGTDAEFWGAYVKMDYWLTGEFAKYSRGFGVWGRVRPDRNIGADGGIGGAWMISLRFDHLDLRSGGLDGGILDTTTLGVTWIWTPNVRVKANAVYAESDGGPEGSGRMFNFVMRFQFDF